jgi:hypothetical protein
MDFLENIHTITESVIAIISVGDTMSPTNRTRKDVFRACGFKFWNSYLFLDMFILKKNLKKIILMNF